MRLFTIGFTKKSAGAFFSKLKDVGAKKLIDVRLNNVSQLAGFTKKDDLRYFTKAICGIEYEHLQQLAPTQDILDEYKKLKGEWSVYERKFLDLMAQRHIENLDRNHCHRRLVAEYLRSKWGDVEIQHL